MVAFVGSLGSIAPRQTRIRARTYCCAASPSSSASSPAEQKLCTFVRPLVDKFVSDESLKVLEISYRGKKLTVRLDEGERKPTLQDCQNLSSILDRALEEEEEGGQLTPAETESLGLPDNYSLEVSTPGIREELREDFEFTVFKSFPVRIRTSESFKGKDDWEGALHGRDEKHVRISQKGRIIKIPREIVISVRIYKQIEPPEGK